MSPRCWCHWREQEKARKQRFASRLMWMTGGFAEAAEVQASAADPSCWLDVEGDRVHKSTLVRHVFERKGTSNDRTRRVQSMYGASSHSQAATPRIEDKDVICTGDPVSVLVHVGGRRALVLAQVAKLRAPGQSAPFSLPSSQAFSKSTTIEATVLQLLPVVGEAGVQAKPEQLWQWDGRHVGSISERKSGRLCQPLAHAPRCWISCVPGCHLSALKRGSRPAL
jgi:hypothetical protein